MPDYTSRATRIPLLMGIFVMSAKLELTTEHLFLLWNSLEEAVKEYQGGQVAWDDPCYIDADHLFKIFFKNLTRIKDENIDKVSFTHLEDREGDSGQ